MNEEGNMDNNIDLTTRERALFDANPDSELITTPSKLTGVAGWLGLLAISLVALGPLLTVAFTASEIGSLKAQFPGVVGSPHWNTAVAVSWAATLAYCSLSVFAGYRLFKHHVRSTVPIVIACLWILWIFGPGSLIAVQYMSGGNTVAADIGADFGRAFISCFGWTLYLLFSKRVKNTYKTSEAASLGERLRGLDRAKRQYIFFSVCWLVLSLIYFTFLSPPDPYADELGPNMWAIILLPPILLGIGAWAYERFVGSSDA